VTPSLSFAEALRRGLMLTTFIVAVALLWWAQRVLIPLALAILLAFVLRPIVSILERRRLPRVGAVLVVVLAAFLLVAAVGWTVLRQFDDLSRQLDANAHQIATKLERSTGREEGTFSTLTRLVREIGKQVQRESSSGARDDGPPAPVAIPDGATLQGWLPKVAEPVLETIADSFLVIVLAVFILSQREDLRDRLIGLAGKGHLMATTRALDDTDRRLTRYLALLCLVNIGFGLAVALGLALLGVPYAPLWGFLAAVLRFVPYVGAWLAALLPFTLTVAVAPGWVQPISVVVLFVVLQLLYYHFIEPVLYGQNVGVMPVALLVAAAFWTWLWGPVGLVLSTPLTICLVVLGKYVTPLQFLNVLLSAEPPLERTMHYYQRLLAHDQDEAVELVEDYLQEHRLEELYDEVLLPALVLAGRDRERKAISAEDVRLILQATRAIVESQEAAPTKRPPPPAGEGSRRLMLAWPARSAMDELALEMFRQLLVPLGCLVEIHSQKRLAAELLDRARHSCPFLVIIAAVPPGGLSQAQYLCRLLRHHCRQTKVVVGRWGQEEQTEATRTRLRQAGADLVGMTLRVSRDHVIALLQPGAPLPCPEQAPQAVGAS
jgi:predicted PurR-regulated permease PerM